MKKITITLLLVLYSIVGFSQVFFEGFENTTGPDAAPSTNWTLGSGNWAVFDNNVGGTYKWGINSSQSNSGTNAAYVTRENIGFTITDEDYLATPMITVPNNGKLQFYSRSFTAGNQGTLYQVKVALATSPQNATSSYTILLEELGENQLSPAFGSYWKKIYDLSPFAGQNIYIAFVRKYTQPSPALSGDRFLLDDVSVIEGTGCDSPSDVRVSYSNTNQLYTLTWNADTATSWEVAVIPAYQGIPASNETVITTSINLFTYPSLTDNFFHFCVRRICTDGSVSSWSIAAVHYPPPPVYADCTTVTSFIDNDNSGTYNSGEIYFFNKIFSYELNNSGVVSYSQSNYSNKRYCNSPSNTADFGCQIMPEYTPYYSLTTNFYNDIPFSNYQNLYFAVTLTQSLNDMGVYMCNAGRPRPGMGYTTHIWYRNYGSTPMSAIINFNNDPLTTIESVYPNGAVLSSNGFTYQTETLAPGQGRYLRVVLNVPPLPDVAIGDILNNSVSFSSTSIDDYITNNNNFTLSSPITGAFDPNDKTESHGGKIQFNQFTNEDYLYYTINFQNIGNASANEVRIEDVLDSQLDETTIQMIESSHNYYMDRTGSNLTWHFDNIQLLPAFVNDNLSKGFVLFKVKPKPSYAVGDIIPNSAAIYFDTNPAIITNTFNTEFVDSLGNPRFDSNNVFLAPNPANETIQIQLQNTSETIASVTITDVLGKNIRTLKATTGNQMNVDIANVSQGVYFVEIITQNGLKQTKKLIKK